MFEIRKRDNPLTVQIQFIGLNDRRDASPAETNIFFIQGGSQVAFYDLRKSPTQPIRILTLSGYKKLQQPGQFIGKSKVLFGGERGGSLYDLKTGQMTPVCSSEKLWSAVEVDGKVLTGAGNKLELWEIE